MSVFEQEQRSVTVDGQRQTLAGWRALVDEGDFVITAEPLPPVTPRGVCEEMQSRLEWFRDDPEQELTEEAELEIRSWLDAIERRIEKLRAKERPRE